MSKIKIRVTPEERTYHHELLLAGASVSGLWVHDLSMRIGTATVRMGGIGGVGTDRKHRNKGFARRVLENSNEWMTANGFDCAILFGITDFYDKFGYAVCLPDCRYELATRDAERASTTLTARPYEPEDRGAVMEIYAANNRELTGSIARDDRTELFHKGSGWDADAEAFVFTDSTGGIVAYAARDASKENVRVCEAGMRQPHYAAAIMRWAAERAVELRVEKITWLVPPDSLLGVYLTQFETQQRLSYPRNGGGMGRLLNLNAFFAKTLSEWTRRASAARMIGQGTSLKLETDIGAITLVWSGQEIELNADAEAAGVVRLPQWRLMQLAMGYYGSDFVLSLPDLQAEGRLDLFHTLFPRRLPYMWVTDHF